MRKQIHQNASESNKVFALFGNTEIEINGIFADTTRMLKETKRVFLVIAGIICILLGLVGLVLPFFQGFLFLGIGVILLSIASRRVRGWVKKHTQKYPPIHRFMTRTQKWVVRIIGPFDS